MAIAGATLVATVDENINTEFIARQIRITLGRIPFTFMAGAKRVEMAANNTKVYEHPIRDEVAKATPYTETDLVTSTPVTRTSVPVSTAKNLKATFLSIEAVELSMWAEFAGAIDEMTQANLRAVDDDFLSLADEFSATQGDAATVMTASNLILVHTTWRAQVASTREMPIMYMVGDAFRDLQQDALGNGAALFSSVVGVQLHGATNAVNQGEMSMFNNVRMVQTDNLPVGDVTGHSNMMIATGENDCAIAYPIQHGVRVEVAYREENQGWWVIASSNYGMGIVNDDAGLTFITQT